MPNLTPKEIKCITDGYLKAAELIATEEQKYSCCAIIKAFGISAFDPKWATREEVLKYLNIFSPIPGNPNRLQNDIQDDFDVFEKHQLLRYDLLTLMAWAWKDFR